MGILRLPPWRIKRKSTLIQPNRSAGFFRFNLREPFFSTDQRRKKTTDLFAGFLRLQPWRIKRKSTLIQPNRSVGFFCANLREPFFHADQRRKKYADLFVGILRLPQWWIKRKSTLTQPNRSAGFFRFNLREPFYYAPPRRIRRKKHADLVHCNTINLQAPKETFGIQVDGLLAACRPWSVNRQPLINRPHF